MASTLAWLKNSYGSMEYLRTCDGAVLSLEQWSHSRTLTRPNTPAVKFFKAGADDQAIEDTEDEILTAEELWAALQHNPVNDLLACFMEADGRIKGLPIYNDSLTVEARPFLGWQAMQIGVVITPWCMNLILLPSPDEETAWDGLREGQEIDHVLPCGRVRFVVGDDGRGGLYQMCSLFSPMDDFATQDSARAVADETLSAVLKAPEAEKEAEKPTSAKDVSRRDLFRGGFRRDKAVNSDA